MKIAIIADLHDNLANLERFLILARELGIGGIIFCGDVTTPETLEELASKFEGPIKLVCGNVEIGREEFEEIAKNHINLEVFPEVGEWLIEGVKIGFVHRPERVKELVVLSAGEGDYQLIFHGHTHQPWIKEEAGVIIANPGTLGGVFTSPTFAIFSPSTGQLELKRLWA